MIKNSKRRYVVILYIVLLTFFVSILYYGRIHHFGQISTGNETIIGLKPVNDKKKNEVKEDFRNTVSEEDDYVGPRNNRKINSIIKNKPKYKSTTNTTNTTSTTSTTNTTNTTNTIKNFKVWVDDKIDEYLAQTEIDIFSYSALTYHNTTVVTDKIAPGVGNIYKFKVHNQSSFSVKYNLSMLETMQYDVNMKYKLKKNGNYVIGNATTWVEPSQLNLSNLVLSSNSFDDYELEWRWFDSPNDNIAGINMTGSYTLNIKVDFEEI